MISAARSRGLSTGVLFLDVKAAYYRVVRELVVDMADDGRSLQRMLQYFNLDYTEEADLLAAVADGNVAEALNIPQQLQHLLREALCNTWFVTERRNTLYECLAGSRPGDGLADVVFALIFRKILQCVKEDFRSEYGDFATTNSQQFDVFVDEPPTVELPALLDVVWADDLAIVVTHRQPEEMLERIRFITSRTFRHCLRHALIPNLKRGKTELLLFIRGAGSRALRGHIFNQPDPFLDIDNVPQEFSRVVVSLCYRHLGSRIQLGRSILPEIKARLGAATQVYRKHRRAIFQNKLLTLDRRKYLFNTMVMSIVKYNTGTWAELSKAESKFFVSRIMTMYRGLLRATVPEDQLRYWNNSMVLATLGLADPHQLLHEARLSFVVSAFRSGPQLLWTLAAAEGLWLNSVRDSRDWLHCQLKGLGPDKFGVQWNPNYEKVCREQPDVFKRWIKKAAHHARLQHELVAKWQEFHHDFLLLLIQQGYQIAFPWPSGKTVGEEIPGEACLLCDRIFKNRAAWAVHAFKVHHRANDRRYLINGTRCEACMREFGSMDKLQRHLTYKTRCAVQLRQAGHFYPIQPGINSTQQRKPMTFPIPVMNTQGPQRQWTQPTATEWFDGVLPDFEEALWDCALAMKSEQPFLEMVDCFKEVFRRQWSALADLFSTFRHFRQEMIRLWEDLREEDSVPITILGDVLQWVETRMHLRWFFSEERCSLLPDADDLRSAAWYYCRERSAFGERAGWQDGEPIPRFVQKELVFLHLFSGEKRAGDLQDALHEINIPRGCVRVILAVDIIYDSVNADLSSAQIQARWMDFIRRGYIAALYAGPPCESWSRSRKGGGVPEHESGDGGPRVVRLAQCPYGIASLTVREVQQLLLANTLLLFALQAFFAMVLCGRFAMIEHPATPSDPSERWLASIWKLYIVEALRKHPWVQTATIFQGHYGAKSPKPTTLMFACGSGISVDALLKECRTTQQLPKALKMGRSGGEYTTASLKNYPEGLCRALAFLLENWLAYHVPTDFAEAGFHNPDHGHFLLFVQRLMIQFNFDALRGADCAL